MKRLFFGTWLDDVARDEAAAAQAMVREIDPELRITPREKLHLTLRFLGQASDEQSAALGSAVDPLRAGWRGASLVGDQVEAWASVVVSVLQPQADVATIAADLEQLARRLGFSPEHRAFNPHVTLARGRSRAAFPHARLSMHCNHVALIESVDGRYEERKRWSLA